MQLLSESCFDGEPAWEPAKSRTVILLVDDDVTLLNLCKELLEDAGYCVLVASDGVDAVELYRERWQEIALVVLDLAMPNLDGTQTYRRMKQTNPCMRSFFWTGYSSDEMTSGLLSGEHVRVLKKPFHPAEFIRAVREALQGQ